MIGLSIDQFFCFFLWIPVCDVCFLWRPASVPRETKVVLGQNRVHHPSKSLVLYRHASRGVPREAPSLSTFVSTSATGPTFSAPFVMNTPGMNTQLKYLSKKKKLGPKIVYLMLIMFLLIPSPTRKSVLIKGLLSLEISLQLCSYIILNNRQEGFKL